MDASRLAALMAWGYAAYLLSGGLVSLSSRALSIHFASPEAWLVVILAFLAGLGLWLHRPWGWWIGLIGGALQAYRLAERLLAYWKATGSMPPVAMLLFLALVLFLILLLSPGPRRRALG